MMVWSVGQGKTRDGGKKVDVKKDPLREARGVF